MKIGILTQPLQTNYGGLLQAFALQTVLKQMGHEVWTFNRDTKETPLWLKLLSITKRLALYIFHNKSTIVCVWPTTKEQNKINQHTNRFIKENIQTIENIDSKEKYLNLKKYAFNAYIVGSDQVWRPVYSSSITNYFLDFLDEGDKVKRIAYAASFGVDNWEFSDEQTMQCSSLAKRFDSISVREDSAIKLCKEHLGVNAIQVLDPTMLLTKEDYKILIDKDNTPESKGNLMTYILDDSQHKNEIIQKTALELNLKPFAVRSQKTFSEVGKDYIEECILPPVTEWIRGFMDADFVITDSFHGTVFSIIFNKPFIIIGNKTRGLARIESLLRMYKLEERLVYDKDSIPMNLLNSDKIDWQKINDILESERIKSLLFLKQWLTL